jgi:hypothetical protein
MRLTGKTLDSLKVRRADAGSAVAEADVYDADAVKLLQLSEADQAAIDAKAASIFEEQAARINGRKQAFASRTYFGRSS